MDRKFEQLRQIGNDFFKKASGITRVSNSPREVPVIIDTTEEEREYARLLRSVMRAISVVSTVHNPQTGETYKVVRHLEPVEEKAS